MRQHQLWFIPYKLQNSKWPKIGSGVQSFSFGSGIQSFSFGTLLLLIAFFFAPFCWGSDYDVMLDASGSMRGFKKQEQTWKNLLNRLESSARHKYQFGNKNNFKRVKQASLFEVRLRDQETYLGQALKDWLSLSNPGDVVVIITDNVADTGDTGGNSSHSQQLFYDLLSKPNSPFSHIAIFSMTLPFRGKVYPIKRGGGRFYKGPRALSIYAIARNYSDEAFGQLRHQIEMQITEFDHQYIQVKPFDSSTMRGLVGDIEIESDPNQDTKVSFETDENGIKHLMVRRLRLGNEIKFSFKVNIRSNSSFELQDVELFVDINLNRDEIPHITMEENFSTEVKPRRATISPDGFQDIRVFFENDPFYYGDLDFWDKLAFTMQNNLLIHGNLEIQFKASRENMHLSQGIIRDWSYEGAASNLDKPREDVQKKIYKLGDLVKSMLPEKTEIQKLHSVPIILELRYPLWPLLVAILTLFLLGGIFWWIIARPSKEYILEDDMGHQTPVMAGFGQLYPHYLEGHQMFSLRSWAIGFWVSSRFSLKSPHFINSGQNIRLFDPETGDEYNWFLREVMAQKPSDDDDKYDMDW